MDDLKQQLLAALREIPGLEIRPSPVAGGTALFYNNLELAHFHHDRELDLRLTRKVIQALGLVHPPGSLRHRHRSPNSAWIEVRFNQIGDIEHVAQLVRRAIAVR